MVFPFDVERYTREPLEQLIDVFGMTLSFSGATLLLNIWPRVHKAFQV